MNIQPNLNVILPGIAVIAAAFLLWKKFAWPAIVSAIQSPPETTATTATTVTPQPSTTTAATADTRRPKMEAIYMLAEHFRGEKNESAIEQMVGVFRSFVSTGQPKPSPAPTAVQPAVVPPQTEPAAKV